MKDRISKCISCGGTNFRFYSQNRSLNLPMYICQDCHLYVTGESSDEIEARVNDYYDKEFWDDARKTGLDDDYSDTYSRGRLRLWSSQFKYCKRYIKASSTILEVGSGHGEAIKQFDSLGFHVTGIEPDKKNVENIRKNLKHGIIINAKAETFQLESEYDFVWMSHVFEHLTNPIEFLQNIKKNLKKNGLIFIEVPNVEKKNDHRKFTGTPHAYNYSKLSLMNIIKKADYEIVRCDCMKPPKRHQGLLNKICTKVIQRDFYSYYPKLVANISSGEDIRLLAKKRN